MCTTVNNKITLYLVRHGKTPSNQKKAYTGTTDEPLCEEGIEELKALYEKGFYPKVEKLYCSPMIRCQMTADILFAGEQKHFVNDLRELSFGDFEGLNHKELKKDPRYKEWINSMGEDAPPNGESLTDFCSRLSRGMCELLSSVEDEKEVAAVVHGGTIMGLLKTFAGCEYYDNITSNGNGFKCLVEYEKQDGQVLADSIKMTIENKLFDTEGIKYK